MTFDQIARLGHAVPNNLIVLLGSINLDWLDQLFDQMITHLAANTIAADVIDSFWDQLFVLLQYPDKAKITNLFNNLYQHSLDGLSTQQDFFKEGSYPSMDLFKEASTDYPSMDLFKEASKDIDSDNRSSSVNFVEDFGYSQNIVQEDFISPVSLNIASIPSHRCELDNFEAKITSAFASLTSEFQNIKSNLLSKDTQQRLADDKLKIALNERDELKVQIETEREKQKALQVQNYELNREAIYENESWILQSNCLLEILKEEQRVTNLNNCSMLEAGSSQVHFQYEQKVKECASLHSKLRDLEIELKIDFEAEILQSKSLFQALLEETQDVYNAKLLEATQTTASLQLLLEETQRRYEFELNTLVKTTQSREDEYIERINKYVLESKFKDTQIDELHKSQENVRLDLEKCVQENICLKGLFDESNRNLSILETSFGDSQDRVNALGSQLASLECLLESEKSKTKHDASIDESRILEFEKLLLEKQGQNETMEQAYLQSVQEKDLIIRNLEDKLTLVNTDILAMQNENEKLQHENTMFKSALKRDSLGLEDLSATVHEATLHLEQRAALTIEKVDKLTISLGHYSEKQNSKIFKTQTENETLKQQLNDRNSKIEMVIAMSETESDRFKAELDSKSTMCQSLSDKIAELDILIKNSSDLISEKEALWEQKELEISKELNQKTEQIGAIQAELESEKEDLLSKNVLLSSLQSQLVEVKAALEKTNEEYKSKEENYLKQITVQSKRSENTITNIQNELEILKTQLDNIYLEKTTIQQDLDESNKKHEETLSEAKKEIASVKKANETLQHQNAEFVQNLQAMKAVKNRLEKEVLDQRGELMKLLKIHSPEPVTKMTQSETDARKHLKRSNSDEATTVVHAKKKNSQAENKNETPIKGKVTHDIENLNMANTSTPASVRKTRMASAKILISFSGFKEGTKFDSKLKKELSLAIKKLPDAAILSGTTSEGQTYDKRITHLIQPPSSKTLKTFGACLTSAWLIQDPQWIFDSVAKGLWLPEEKYGYRIDVNPFKNTKIYMTPAFKECPTTKGFRVGFMKCLVIGCSDGSFVDTPKEADYVLVGDNEDKR